MCFIQNPLGVKVIGGHFPCMRYNRVHFLCQLTCFIFQLSVLLEQVTAGAQIMACLRFLKNFLNFLYLLFGILPGRDHSTFVLTFQHNFVSLSPSHDSFLDTIFKSICPFSRTRWLSVSKRHLLGIFCFTHYFRVLFSLRC